MVIIKAFLSGRLGRALYIESGAWWVADEGLVPRPARTSEIYELESHLAEFREYYFRSIDALQKTLQSHIRFANVTFLALRMLDPTSQEKTRILCAEAIEHSLCDLPLAEQFANWLFSANVLPNLQSDTEEFLPSLGSLVKLTALIKLGFTKHANAVDVPGQTIDREGTPENLPCSHPNEAQVQALAVSEDIGADIDASYEETRATTSNEDTSGSIGTGVGDKIKHFFSGLTGVATGHTTIPIIEEELVVGKREVDRGGVRVYSHLVETPVSADVNLRDEFINVERRSVNRPASAADFTAGTDNVIELHAVGEEAVVGKHARVIEEVLVGREASQHTEAIQESVRKTEVDVEEMPGDARTTGYARAETTGTTKTSY